ncbi:MAG: glucosamine-6-phosphate deaminase [Acidobacteriaceae bacterium]|nr:glucosamine-6-phosphate deaminase [Acidobacteriaceae bacterium]
MSTSSIELGKPLQYGRAKVQIFATREELGLAAAKDAAALIEKAIAERGSSRVMIATGNSQLDVVKELVKQPNVDWSKVDVFHMDEYVGVDENHPAGFQRWIRERVEDVVHPRSVNYIVGLGDVDKEIARYTELLEAGPLDIAFVGFGENGHIAFNDPPVADFNDPKMLKRVKLDQACRAQQVNEGHFSSMETVPAEAISVTCSGLLRAKAWISCVPEARKAKAVRCALEGPITTECPASIARTRDNVSIYLDKESAQLLTL